MLQPLADSLTDEDGDQNGGVDLFNRRTKATVNISRPQGNGHESSSGPGWPPKNLGSSGFSKERGGSYARRYSSVPDDNSFPSDFEKEDQAFPTAKTEKQYYARAEQRTIIAKNLSDRVTHKDIVDIVRGGAVLDIFIRANDRSASISFVEGSAAQEFMSYAKRNDVYIHGKRVISTAAA